MPHTKLETLFPPQIEYKNYHPQMIRAPKGAATYTVYPLEKFADLKQSVLETKHGKPNRFRFLINSKGELWFAAEGAASRTVPAHYQITGASGYQASCYAAGTITICNSENLSANKEEADDKPSLVSIDHKSGDFRPDFHSLKLLLIIFANSQELPFKIDSSFVIKRLTAVGGVEDEYKILAEDLKTLKPESDFEIALRNQPKEKKEVTYKNQAPGRFSLASQFQYPEAHSLFADLASESEDNVATSINRKRPSPQGLFSPARTGENGCSSAGRDALTPESSPPLTRRRLS